MSTLSRQTKIRIIAIPLALIVAGVWYYNSRGNTTGPEQQKKVAAQTIDAGDCVQNKGTESDPDLKKVDCGGAAADYKVKEQWPLDHECEPGLSTYQVTRKGRAQYTLCMEKLAG
ncbi:LppU/SCO3897 family protein [Streptomyces cucumeris]|uniref:LppU/SCO3897 family protein n=1 Tax=Streptomyces cucumeris TaxID=2962890 RepID=UPI003D71A726